MLAGPSEILILADESARADYIAADMLSQAEHDVLASSVLITDSENLAAAVESELERQLELLPRREMAAAALEGQRGPHDALNMVGLVRKSIWMRRARLE